KLDLSPDKTLITHGRSHAARFLGYDLTVQHNDQRRTRTTTGVLRRSVSGVIALKVPPEVVRTACAAYLARGKPVHRGEQLHGDPLSIAGRYEPGFRGLGDYSRLAVALYRLGRLGWIMERSLTMTLAEKSRTSVRQFYRRYRTRVVTERGRKPVLQVT